MSPLFKYFTEEKFAFALIERGEVFMQTLATFRGHEDGGVRGDRNDGRLRYQPAGGLQITTANGEIRPQSARTSFVSSAQSGSVYLYCLSMERSEELAERFNSPFCVELQMPVHLIGGVRRKIRLRSQLDRKQLFHGPVEYRSLQTIPGIDWALPERVAFIKPEDWEWQHEYRVVIGKKGAFDVENVNLSLEDELFLPVPVVNNPPLTLALGDLSRSSILHRF